MFQKILIANRGEIAVRIIRACREMGIATVAVYSEADRSALHTKIADQAVCIGPAPTKDSYLNVWAILSACELTGAQAVHPGFGFLSESADFAKKCRLCGVEFIGPDPSAIQRMGDKAAAKQTMKDSGVPVVPGSDGELESVEEAVKLAAEIGYPVLVKASAGGGGRGIRRAENPEELRSAFPAARQEALSFFGNGGVYLEKFIGNPRHVEIQIFGDKQGNVVHLGERDGSIQRRNQQVLEEAPSPSPVMTPELRARMGADAVKAAKAVGYYGAGTIEFLLDKDGNYYFMEMNTRIQVEHPVTELVTGIDLVKAQLLVAAGEPLPFSQDQVELRGHAIECRINAENPKLGFRPSPGAIQSLNIPGGPGVRVDSAVYQGYVIPPYYDSMIAKVIVYAPDRDTAIRKMKWALAEFLVEGVDTNIDFQLNLLRDRDFESGNFDVGFLERRDLT